MNFSVTPAYTEVNGRDNITGWDLYIGNEWKDRFDTKADAEKAAGIDTKIKPKRRRSFRTR
jgi:hypothetical protein